MWKPIEIKPGDQSLVGLKIKGEDWSESLWVEILAVGNETLFVRSNKNKTESTYGFLGWQIFEPDIHKRLVAPALAIGDPCMEPRTVWITDKLFSSIEEAKQDLGDYFWIWPAPQRNQDGFYEVPG